MANYIADPTKSSHLLANPNVFGIPAIRQVPTSSPVVYANIVSVEPIDSSISVSSSSSVVKPSIGDVPTDSYLMTKPALPPPPTNFEKEKINIESVNTLRELAVEDKSGIIAASGGYSDSSTSIEAAFSDWSYSESTSREAMYIPQPRKVETRPKGKHTKIDILEQSDLPAQRSEGLIWKVDVNGTLVQESHVEVKDKPESHMDKSSQRALQCLQNVSSVATHCIEGNIYSTCFGPYGSRFAVGFETSVGIYERLSQRCTLTYDALPTSVVSLCFSPDGRTLAVGLKDDGLILFDTHSYGRLWSVSTTSSVLSLCFSPDGYHLLAAVGFAEFLVIDAYSGKRVRSVSVPSRNGLCFARDGETVVAAGRGKFTVLNTSTYNVRFIVPCLDVCNIKISPDGKRVITGIGNASMMSSGTGMSASASEIQVWDLNANEKSFTLTRTIKGHLKTLSALCISEDGGLLAAACDRMVKVWNLTTFESHQLVELTSSIVGDISFKDDNVVVLEIKKKKMRSW